jgi:hypothetical protein
MANPYDFLNDYLSKVNEDSGKADPNTDMDDDNDFYETQSNDDQPEEDIEYGISAPDAEDDEQPVDDQQPQADNGDNDVLDQLLGDDDPYGDANIDDDETDGGDRGVEGVTPMAPYTITAKSKNTSRLKSDISDIESGGKYSAFNSKGGGGGAVGKYQFRWNIWQDSIKKITGIKSKDQFLKSPQAQEKYFSWYSKNYLKPQAEKLDKYNKEGLSMDQLEKLVHFRGAGDAKKYLQGKLADKPESYNMSISKYIAKKQTGGMGIATTRATQANGLNDQSFDEMMFPMHGDNIFRGLDNEEPVYLEDEVGKKKILRGRHQTVKMRGKVYEKRMNN